MTLNAQIISVVYNSGKYSGTSSSSNITSSSQIIAISITIVKSPSVTISNGNAKALSSGLKK